jgi:NADPH2:quinone reductase
VAQYNGVDLDRKDRLPGFFSLVLSKSLTVRGFIQNEFVPEMHEDFLTEASAWVRDGRLRYREDVVDGLENAPEAFIGMLQGKNFGKLLVRV